MKSKADFPSLNTKRADGIKPSGKPYKVMIVEGRDFQRLQISQILESEGYEIVASVGNGQEAISELDRLQDKVDLITTDLDMPVLDGYALMCAIKERPKKPVVVFISDDTTKGVMKDLIEMGIADFILKPVNRRILLERIKKAVSRITT
jgi:two-component system, chemotaxis family, chemotaxis protein CheY